MNDQEQNWIQAAKNGDQAAFGHLVETYQKRVYALTVRMCPTRELAEEAAQEVFLSAWQGLPFFRGDSAFPHGCTGWRPTPAWTCCGRRAATRDRPWTTRP